jgi:hypothetical protein
VQPYNVYVSISYPPDTDTPGFKEENLTKPETTALICGAGSVFQPEQVSTSGMVGLSGVHDTERLCSRDRLPRTSSAA